MKRYEIQKDDLEIEPDSIIDTQTNVLYECNSGDMNELCKILNKQDTKWQKLKEWLEQDIKNKSDTDYQFILDEVEGERLVLEKMQELEEENVKS